MGRCVLEAKRIYEGSLILVNPEYGYREQEREDLVPAWEGMPKVQMERRAAVLLAELMGKIRGWERSVPVSGWRSRKEQQIIWEECLEESGEEFTRKFVAVPGHSEHQTGLAIDLGRRQEEIDFICPEFPYTGICGAFRRYAADYGFVERYPAGKETVTGIGHEPWHFRYVGVPHAHVMTGLGLTLEEYLDFMKDYPHGRKAYPCRVQGVEMAVSYLAGELGGETVLEIPGTAPWTVSGNNVDGFIVTVFLGR